MPNPIHCKIYVHRVSSLNEPLPGRISTVIGGGRDNPGPAMHVSVSYDRTSIFSRTRGLSLRCGRSLSPWRRGDPFAAVGAIVAQGPQPARPIATNLSTS